MDDPIKFYYAHKRVKQLAAFQGESDIYVYVNVGVGHLSLNDTLLCGQTQEEIEKELGADGHETVVRRYPGVPICPDCQKRWKELPGSPWQRWVNQWPKQA